MAIVGIDLGTTNSAIAVDGPGGPRVLSVNGKDVTPSIVGISGKTRQRVVGEAAQNEMHSDPVLAAEEMKRDMGTSKRVQLGQESFLPQELSANLLRFLKKAAEDQLGEPVDRAVITVPANFPDPARQATKLAGELAGLQVERVVNEPTAAALAYGHAAGTDEEVVMVYDLGGGTFDVSVVEYFGDALDVKASAGDPHLGGKDFDRALLDLVIGRVRASHDVGEVVPGSGRYYRLLHACEQAKKDLSFNPVARIHVPFWTVVDGQPVTVDEEVTRVEFERLIAPMVDRTEEAIKRALKRAGVDRSKVDRVLLVGGSTRVPYVRELVERVVGRRPSMDVDPDKAVALGAAVQASIIDGQSDAVIMDVVSDSLGTTTLVDIGGVPMSGYYSEIIPAGEPMLKARTERFNTLFDNQEVVDLKVYQRNEGSVSEWAEVKDEPNTSEGFVLLGKQEVPLPPGPQGQAIDVTFTPNLDGIIQVEVRFPDHPDRVETFDATVLLDADALAASRAKLEGQWEESEFYDGVRASLHAADRKLTDDLSESDRLELDGLVTAMKGALSKNDGDEVRRLDGLLTDLLFDLED